MSKEVQNQLPTTAAVFFCVIQHFFLSACEYPILFLIFNAANVGGAVVELLLMFQF